MKTNRMLHGAIAALALVTWQAARADDQPVTLAQNAKTGDVTHYKASLSILLNGMEVAKIEQKSRDEVKEVKKDGAIVTASYLEGGKAGDQDLPTGIASTETRDKLGKLIDYKNELQEQSPLTPEVQRLLAMLQSVLFQEKSVKASDSWQTELDNPVVKGKKVVVKTTYLGTESVDDKPLWKVKQTSEAETDADGKNKLSYDMTSWLDPANGRMVKATMTMKNVPIAQAQAQATVNIDATVERVKPDAEKKDK